MTTIGEKRQNKNKEKRRKTMKKKIRHEKDRTMKKTEE